MNRYRLMNPAMARGLIITSLLASVFLSSGCASYFTHYAMFPAQNSAGESRQVRISWQTAEYPGWWPVSNQATAMKVELQCSERVWRISDSSQEDASGCSDGISACGDPSRDVLTSTGKPVTENTVCMRVAEPNGKERIASVGSRFDLRVACQPAHRTVRRDGEVVNIDYVRSSPVAYTVYARKVPRGALSARLPDFDDAQCQEN